MSLINIPSSPKKSFTPKDTSQISTNPLSISVTCQLDLDDDASSAFKLGIKKPLLGGDKQSVRPTRKRPYLGRHPLC